MDLKEMAVNRRKWINMARDKDYWRTIVNVTLNFRDP
jgi:hypothetical protein